MLSVHGFFIIPADPKVKEFKTEKGSYFSFQAAGEDKDKNGEPLFHIYQISMWSPANESEKWNKLLVPRRAFYLKSGDLVAPLQGEKIGFTQVKTSSQNIKPMTIGLWFVPKE